MKFTEKLAVIAVSLLLLTGCTVAGEDGGGDGGGTADTSDQAFTSAETTLEKSYAGAEKAMEGKRIAFVPLLLEGYGLTTNWFENMKRSLEPMGATVTAYDANFDPEKMVSTVDQIIREKSADVLVLHNIDVGILSTQIEAAEEAGIYVITVNMLGNRLGDAYVGPNTSRAARDIATRAIEDCKARGASQLTIIDGPGTDAASIEWTTNITKVVEEAGLTVTEAAHSGYVDAKAREIAETTIARYGSEVCGFMVLFDGNSIAVGDAVKEAVQAGTVAEGEVGVYTFSADARVCDAMQQGLVTASAAYDVPGMGSAVVATIQQLVQTNQKPGAFHTVSLLGHEVIDASNMAEYNVACWVNK